MPKSVPGAPTSAGRPQEVARTRTNTWKATEDQATGPNPRSQTQEIKHETSAAPVGCVLFIGGDTFADNTFPDTNSVDLGSVWVDLGSYWIDLGLIWGRFGMILWSVWDVFGIDLGSVWG